MSCRGTAHRLAVVVLLVQCFSALAMADPPGGAPAEPSSKTDSGDPPGLLPTSSDISQSVPLSRPTSDDVLLLIDHGDDSEKVISKRDGSTSSGVSGLWFGPRMGRKRSDVPSENSAVSGMWFGPRMGRDGRSDQGDDLAANGLWFGPRMGRATGEGTDDRELASMWFGPRMGRSVVKSRNSKVQNDQHRAKENGMWIGSRTDRGYDVDSYGNDGDEPKHDNVLLVFRRRLPDGRAAQDIQERGRWLGPRMGRVSVPKKFDDNVVILNKRSENRESSVGGMWFGPRMGRKREADWEAVGRKGREQTAGMWFGPRLG